MAENKFLKKIFSRKKLLIAGSLGTVLALVFAVNNAHAMEGSYMEGTIGVVGSLFQAIGATIFWVIAGMVSLTITTAVLQWLINNQTTLINFNGDFISKGLGVTQGLADMLLILAFVLASFGIIFQYKAFEAKKTVTTLVLVAIFTRFGTLVVKMMIDIGNVAINTIIGANSTLLWDATVVLLKETLYTVGVSLGVIGGTAVLYAIPWVNLVAAGGTIYSIVSAAAVLSGVDNITTNLAGNATLYFAVNFLLKWIFQIIACHMLSGVYMTYIILFLSRIFWLQILAVASPLAIMAYSLPQTKKFFNQWWGSLVKWTFLGVWTLFLLVLGISSVGFIVPETFGSISGESTGVFSLISVSRYMLYYMFLIVYLSLVKDMADKESGMGTLFKSAMIGAGTMAFTHAIKPAANNAQSRAIQGYMNKQADINALQAAGKTPSLIDNLALHGSGLMAKALDEKQMSNYRGIFAGDSSKTTAAAEGISKNFNLGKGITDPKSLSAIDSLVNSKIGDVGKDSTVEKIMAEATKKGGEINVDKALWALKNAKPEDIPALIGSYGTSTGKYLDYAIKNNMLSPSTLMSIGRTASVLGPDGPNGEKTTVSALAASAGLRDYLLKQDRGGTQAKKVQDFFAGVARTGSQSDQMLENNDLIQRAVLLKEATFNKKSFQNLSGEILGDDKNLKAMLINAPENMLGFARETNEVAYEKMLAMVHDNFDQLAQSNPGLIKAIARKQGFYDEYIPDTVKERARGIAGGDAGEAYKNALRDVIRDMTTPPAPPAA